jgi:hypothetical protein
MRIKIVPMIAAACVLITPLFAACAPTDIKWTEQVKLHDGSVIEVKRRTELSATGFPTSSRGKPRYHELCYAPKGIVWKSKPEYKPEAFDIVDGKAYVRVPLGGCAACMLHGFPDTNSIYFTWSGKEWVKLGEKDAPAQLAFNLLEATHGDDDGSLDARGLITLADKRKRDASIYYVMDRTKAKGLNERPSVRDLCVKCKGIDIRTGSTAEVLLPSASHSCSW